MKLKIVAGGNTEPKEGKNHAQRKRRNKAHRYYKRSKFIAHSSGCPKLQRSGLKYRKHWVRGRSTKEELTFR